MSPGGTHAESATLRTADGGLLVHAVPAAFGCFTHDLPRASCVLAQPELADRPLTNAADALGAVVVVKRGGVPFVEKARHAQQAGAAAVVIVNTAHEPYMAHGHTYADGRVDDGRGLSVPVVCVKLGDGSALASRLPCPVSLAFVQPEEPEPEPEPEPQPGSRRSSPPPLRSPSPGWHTAPTSPAASAEPLPPTVLSVLVKEAKGLRLPTTESHAALHTKWSSYAPVNPPRPRDGSVPRLPERRCCAGGGVRARGARRREQAHGGKAAGRQLERVDALHA